MTDNVIPFPARLRPVDRGKAKPPSSTSFAGAECPEVHNRAYLDLLHEMEASMPKPRFAIKPSGGDDAA